MDELSDGAPAAYPQINRMAGPVRKASAAHGDPEATSLWAGQTYPLAYDASAAVIVERLKVEAREAAARLDRIR
jgi:nitronate monooxygenase